MRKILKIRQFFIYILMVYLVMPIAADADVTNRVDLGLVKEWIQEDSKDAANYTETIADIKEMIQSDLADCARRCNNYRIRLYSCKETRLFETTMYLERVNKMYRELEERAQPNNETINQIDRDILRYQLLQQTLSMMPPALEEYSLNAPLINHISDSIQLIENDTLLHQLIAASSQENKHYLLSEEEQSIRDSCIILAQEYIQSLEELRELLYDTNASYSQLRDEFKSTAQFAEERYAVIRKNIREGGQYTLKQFLIYPSYVINETIEECKDKYTHLDKIFTPKEILIVLAEMFGLLGFSILIIGMICYISKKNPNLFVRAKKNPAIYANMVYMLLLMIALVVDVKVLHLPLVELNAVVFFVYFAFILTLQVSLLLRVNGERASAAMHLYAPSIMFGYILTFLRFFFVPDNVLILAVGPLSFVSFAWQMTAIGKYWTKVSNIDSGIASITTVVLMLMAIFSACGYTFLSMQIYFWWQAQLAAAAVVLGLYFLMKKYIPYIEKRKINYLEKTTGEPVQQVPEYLIQVTWLSDMIRMMCIPMLGILTLPLCIYAALGFYHGGSEFIEFFHRTLFSLSTNGDLVFDLSFYNITLSTSLYFVFRYIKYIATAIYTQVRIRAERIRQGRKEIETNQLNLALGTKVVVIVVWSLYICTVCLIFRLPLQSVTVVIAGMAAGLSFAMQEILNNFFYGIQLMAGRLRVGDYVICDNYRGTVTSISYQTTQICTETGADVSFTNRSLFTNNFQNLTKQNPYEVNRVYVDVAYGSDIKKVEETLLAVISELNRKDKYGRELISMSDVRVEMSNLASSAITMGVRFGVLAEKMTWFMPVLRKALYKRLTEEHINIPYNQLDIRIKND